MIQASRITVQAVVKSPVAQVWEAWNTPEEIMQWNSADPGWHCPSSENDLRVGGKFKHKLAARDGSFAFDFEGVYNTIEPHWEITYTMGDGRMATTIFNEVEGQTQITTTFDAESENTPEIQQEGWQAILNNFVQYVESKRIGSNQDV